MHVYYCRLHRHLSPGLQEFAEAVAFAFYLEHQTLLTKDQFDQYFCVHDAASDAKHDHDHDHDDDHVSANKVSKGFYFLPTDEDYLLGIADLTGELMRYAINCVGSGNKEKAFIILHFLRSINDGLQLVSNSGITELRKKMATLENSLHKVEKVCYEITVRGSEYPRDIILHLLDSSHSSSSSSNMEKDDSS